MRRGRGDTDTLAMAAAEAVETRTATSRKGTGFVSAKGPRRCSQAARSPDKGRAHPPPRAVAMFGTVSAKLAAAFALVEIVAWSKASSATARAGAMLREGARVRHNKQRLLTGVSSRC